MNNSKIITSLLLILISTFFSLTAQPEVKNAVHYTQISNFESDYSIAEMKMSFDGSKIIFSTAGAEVKVFTINTNGTGLKQIYDFQTTGFGPMIDISNDGEKILWCDRYGEIFVSNSDGTNIEEIATLLPNPDTTRADIEPEIPLPPRFTADGSKIYFIHKDRDPRGSGVWSINTNDSDLQLVFNYLDIATQVYARDGSEYNRNTVYTDGFDINGDGSRIIVGIRSFKLEEGDLSRGDAIVAMGNTFYKLSEYALGYQPFSTNLDDDIYLVFKLELNDTTQAEEINVYFQPLGTGDPIKVIGGIDMFGGPAMTQISANNSSGIVHGGNGRLPITFVDRISGSHFDLVSIDGISRGISGFNLSESVYPSINANGDKFCFLGKSIPPQIWIGEILSDGAGAEPKINGVQFTPNYVHNDGVSTATIEAYVSDINHPIDFVTIQSVKDGSIYFRAITADGGVAFFPYLFDDSTHGDQSTGDNVYTNNTVRRDVPETPLGEYGIRIAAVNTSHREITMVDAEPFNIIDQSTNVQEVDNLPNELVLHQNYPNPFNPVTTIKYSIPLNERRETSNVKLIVYDILGREVATLVNQKQKPGNYEVIWDSVNHPSGVYFYQFKYSEYFKTKKMILLK